MTTDPGRSRLTECWPDLIGLKYAGRPDLIKINSGPAGAWRYLAEAKTGQYVIGLPSNQDHLALAYVIESARCLCAVSYPSTRNLLRAALDELAHRPS